MPDGDDLEPLFQTILDDDPGPDLRPRPRRCRRTSPTWTPRRYLGRLALCRIHNGAITKGQQVAWCRRDGTIERVKITELLHHRGPRPGAGREAGPGDIIAVAGIPEITIGETLADPDDPRPLPLITVDEPAISMTIGINTSPLAGRRRAPRSPPAWSRTAWTASWSATCRSGSLPTERPDTWEVQGRGELALAILVETMRREGFELTVGKPQVVTREIDGKLHEPVERLTIDVPETTWARSPS